MNCSLIITTYNWPEALRLVLSSINNQSVLPNEIIIADDGSRESCFIEVGKLVEIIGYFIGNQTVNGIWNVGWENLSYLELAKTVISRYGDSSSRIEKQSTKSARRFNLSLVKLKQFMR